MKYDINYHFTIKNSNCLVIRADRQCPIGNVKGSSWVRFYCFLIVVGSNFEMGLPQNSLGSKFTFFTFLFIKVYIFPLKNIIYIVRNQTSYYNKSTLV